SRIGDYGLRGHTREGSANVAVAELRIEADQARRAEAFKAALRQRILVIDGAMGSMIQGYGLQEADYRGERFGGHGRDLKGNSEALVLTRPDVIEEIHRKYLEAGADL